MESDIFYCRDRRRKSEKRSVVEPHWYTEIINHKTLCLSKPNSLILSFLVYQTAVFDNPAYEDDERLSTNPSFADVVSQLITEPIAEDIHPYGRGHLYATAFHWELPKIHRDEGSLFLWFLATAVVLGLVFSVIFMSCKLAASNPLTSVYQLVG